MVVVQVEILNVRGSEVFLPKTCEVVPSIG